MDMHACLVSLGLPIVMVVVVVAVLCPVVADAGAQPPSHLYSTVLAGGDEHHSSDPLVLFQFLRAWALARLVRR